MTFRQVVCLLARMLGSILTVVTFVVVFAGTAILVVEMPNLQMRYSDIDLVFFANLCQALLPMLVVGMVIILGAIWERR
jgi:hypothetical protein